ncbi:response regulator [Diaphorobacter sp. HDW4A]|uniref:hybrid sensor histidine kinase/response regulator n=1 Tax=Diaphorobacter sp. HDW4A TaxID=2714924 RepID=UPI00140E202E|nr:hybrid sensor histidine kinase/response regulator [Diaphorobacter sp. HDW4A]QIL81230.1 response regulator [Diaphorobacter sp. HDW4A]
MHDQIVFVISESMRQSRIAHAVLSKDDGTQIAVNNALERILKEHHIICGKNLLKDYPEILALISQCQATMKPVTLEHSPSQLALELSPLVGPGNGLHAIQLIAIPLATTTKKLRPQESMLEHRFQKSLEQFPLNVWMSSQQGEIFWINHTANRFSHEQEVVHDASNTYWISKIHSDDLPEANKTFAKAMMDGIVRPFRYRVRDNDGNYHWHLSSYTPIRGDDGEVQHWVGTGINIQSFVDTEARLKSDIETLKASHNNDKRLLKESNDLLAQAQKMELVSNLAGGIAHDLNNLLFIMSLNADLLHKRLQDQELKASANNVRTHIKKAARLASQLMGFSGRKPQSQLAVDPRQLLQDIRELLENAVGAETSFTIQLDDEIDNVLVDKMYLENSLINLAINARDAVAGKGTVTLGVSNAQRHGHEDGVEYVVFKMHDDGEGMPPDVISRIFEPFFTTKAPGKGTGLGLPMVKNFAESSGGFLDVESLAGVGTTMSLYLPKSSQPIIELHTEEEPKIHSGDESLMIIDDDAGVRNALAQALYGVGYHSVTTACNSEYAVEFLSRGVKADLIISDIRMPGKMNTTGFLHKLEEMHLDVPVIFATGYSEDTVIQQGLIKGKHPVLFKPFTLEQLFNKIQETVSAHKVKADR